MKYLVAAVLIFSLVHGGCKKKIPAESNRFDKSRISMEKDPCFGGCPVYAITIEGSGKVMYEGKRFVQRTGKYEKQLTPKETSKLFNAFECSNFTDFHSEYTADITDLPTTWLTFEHRGYKKKIKDHYEAPEELKKLEKLVEDIAMSEEGWRKIE